ncbi:hypothetical protein FV223_25400, partial [Methylobacterium sp. WL116]
LDAMVRQALRPEVGAVGAKLLYANGTLQHAGVVVGLGGRDGLGRKPVQDPGRQRQAVIDADEGRALLARAQAPAGEAGPEDREGPPRMTRQGGGDGARARASHGYSRSSPKVVSDRAG